ncbi:MAG: hypothetical protein PHC34_08525 [Candidatus Gastranaerophilales bacterium]|nr:hypothetical protein [Candidatus Gastranaerophilales bacterium]
MSDKYLAYGGIAGILNSLQSENEIKLFLVKYRKWYINERNLTRWEAEEHIKHDIGFFIKRFIRNPELILKLSSALKISYS